MSTVVESYLWCILARADMAGILEHPNLHLSPEERRLFGQLFSAADTEKIGVVTGEVAVKFFEKTRLSPAVLGEVRKASSYKMGGKFHR